MNMQEALEWAADYAERNKIFAPVLNGRGYPDGWKPPTPQEKAKVITELAKQACSDSDNKALTVLVSNWMEGLDSACGSQDWPFVRAIKSQMRDVLGA